MAIDPITIAKVALVAKKFFTGGKKKDRRGPSEQQLKLPTESIIKQDRNFGETLGQSPSATMTIKGASTGNI